jgi:hypothetical protein
MEKKSLGDYILVDPMEIPTIKELMEAAATLKRCEIIFAKMRRPSDPPAQAIDNVASFLESFIASNKHKLRKGCDGS